MNVDIEHTATDEYYAVTIDDVTVTVLVSECEATGGTYVSCISEVGDDEGITEDIRNKAIEEVKKSIGMR